MNDAHLIVNDGGIFNKDTHPFNKDTHPFGKDASQGGGKEHPRVGNMGNSGKGVGRFENVASIILIGMGSFVKVTSITVDDTYPFMSLFSKKLKNGSILGKKEARVFVLYIESDRLQPPSFASIQNIFKHYKGNNFFILSIDISLFRGYIWSSKKTYCHV